ncbi:hypothetical protein LNP18_10065 [Leuconostoc citreum]|uniref:hypothetical protein n=1 Tax=Leuconostoc citreum TaxID=33964 RepID=UPI00200B83CB|nr:hypothetical protein [Leuconostoc citreum]MCK8606442.1 hypothetical protein [Leuconostoc citreum]
MTKQTMLIGGGIASGLVVLILVILLMGTSKQQQATPTKLPRIDQAKVMKRIDYEIFDKDNDGRYTENIDNEANNTFIDGEKFGNRQASVTDMVYYSALNKDADSSGMGYSYIFKEHEINNITTKWDKDGNTFVAKGNFVVKETGKKYPFAFKFNADYMILQEWFGRDIRI